MTPVTTCSQILAARSGFATLISGDVSERPKVPASKAGVARATEGSNPSVTADEAPGAV